MGRRDQIGIQGSGAGGTGESLTAAAPVNADSRYGFKTEELIRSGFVRKVYGILFCQLLVTFGIVAVFNLVKPIADKLDMNKNPGTAMGVMYGSWGIAFVTMLILVCCINKARTYPMNMILLSVFTLFESIFVGVFSAQYTAWSVLLAVGCTCIVVGALTLFACTTKIDFTGMGMYLYAGLMVMMCFSCAFTVILMCTDISLKSYEMARVGYACIGCLVFSMYLVYDTQLILGGQHAKFQFEVDDYVFAALNIYMDIINLFIYILSILGDRK